MADKSKDLRCTYKCRWCRRDYPSNIDMGACPDCVKRGVMNLFYGVNGGGINPQVAIVILLERIEKLEGKS